MLGRCPKPCQVASRPLEPSAGTSPCTRCQPPLALSSKGNSFRTVSPIRHRKVKGVDYFAKRNGNGRLPLAWARSGSLVKGSQGFRLFKLPVYLIIVLHEKIRKSTDKECNHSCLCFFIKQPTICRSRFRLKGQSYHNIRINYYFHKSSTR